MMKLTPNFILISFLFLTVISCINIPPFIDGKIVNNRYENSLIKLQIPDSWKIRKSGGNELLVLQKEIKKDDDFIFPTVILEAGSLNNNNFHTYFDNLSSLAYGSFNMFRRNDLYKTRNDVDSININGIKFYSFESILDMSDIKRPDLIQKHYYFNIDTVFFHLSISDYEIAKELLPVYESLLKSIVRKDIN